MGYKKYSNEQLERAKNADIIEFLKAYKGYTFKRTGHYYKCNEHNSLVIYSDRRGFVWNSRGITGGDTIDFLRKTEEKSFSEAVETIIGENSSVFYTPAPKYSSEPGKLVLPEKAADGKYSKVFAYLSKTRGISSDVISDFMKSKQLYQDTRGNCVFVGYDDNSNAKFASVRGTLSEKQYRGDCKNSDKRYAFHQKGKDISRLYIFEAPIDLMSHCTMTNNVFNDKNAYKNQTRLALCGSSDVALEAFLEKHKDVKVLNFRLDNDDAGRKAVQIYKVKYEAKGYDVHYVFSKNKDINEDLIKRENKNLQIKR